MNKEQIRVLIDQYIAGSIAEPGLNALREEANSQPALMAEMLATAWEENPAPSISYDRARMEASLEHLLSIDRPGSFDEYDKTAAEPFLETELQPAPSPVRTIFNYRKWLAIAALLALVATGGYLFLHQKKEIPVDISVTKSDVEPPRSNRATITLSNGSKVFLDSAANGSLAMQGNTQLTKLSDGVIKYAGSDDQADAPENTLYNPRGSKAITLTLSDGTQVWLNAASSLTYPVAFTGTMRKVSITGEAYFEVAHNPNKPFRVELPSFPGEQQKRTVEVLGTHFNINAYPDEKDIRTTLLEGSVRINNGKVLQPNQQGVLTGNDYQLRTGVDIDQIMAWKNGRFSFEGVKLEEAMKQLERWYDIEVRYSNGKIPDIEFFGSLSREKTLAELLNALKDSGVHFKIENRILTVNP